MDTKHVSRNFKAFSDATRLKILGFLRGRELTVSQLVRIIKVSQPTVSRHLAMLLENGFVANRRRGQQVFYRLQLDKIKTCCERFCACLTDDGNPDIGLDAAH